MKLNEKATPEQYEAMRLINLFGCKADLVVDEIKKYDKSDWYFWDCVKHELTKINDTPSTK